MEDKRAEKEIRYFIDLDLKNRKIISWGFGYRKDLIEKIALDESHHRVYMSKGQYNKLEKHTIIQA